MNFLGLMYGDGWGVPQDYLWATYWLQKASAAGHALATYNLAVIYDNGFGVAISRCKAFQLFVIAAQQGYADAMQSIGDMYEKGQGTEQNQAKARYWYKQGAQAGYATAMYDLGRCYMRGIGGAKNLSLARRWLEAANLAGEPEALLALGNYFTLLPSPDWESAFHWYERAIEEGTQEVRARTLYNLGKLVLKGVPVPIPRRTKQVPAKEYFQWAAKFGHQGAALRLALLLGEIF